MAVCAGLAVVAAGAGGGCAEPQSPPQPVASSSTPAVAPELPAHVARLPVVRSNQTGDLRLLPSRDGVLVVATYFGGGSTKGTPRPKIERDESAAWWCAGPPCEIAARPGPMPDRNPLSIADEQGVVYALPSAEAGPSVIDLARCDPTGCRPAGTVRPPLRQRLVLAVAVDGPDLLLLHTDRAVNGQQPPPAVSELWLARCPIASCSTGFADHRVATAPHRWLASDLALAVRNGHPVVAYQVWQTDRTMFLLCADRACARPARPVEVAGQDRLHWHSMRILGDGRIAVLAGLTLTTCDDPTCTTMSVVRLPDGRGKAAYRTDLTVDRDGRLLVVTADNSGDVLLRSCADPACRTSSSVVVGLNSPGHGSAVAVAVDTAGRPLIGWLSHDTLTLVACRNPGCR